MAESSGGGDLRRFRFDFVEIFAGSARVTEAMENLGFSVSPPIDLSFSEELDLQAPKVMEWLAHLICNRFIKAFVIEPPCTTFSIMSRPALRSKEFPYGFEPWEEKTHTGNVLAMRGAQSLHLAYDADVAGVMENR